jgi:hypothetical protein
MRDTTDGPPSPSSPLPHRLSESECKNERARREGKRSGMRQLPDILVDVKIIVVQSERIQINQQKHQPNQSDSRRQSSLRWYLTDAFV